MGDMKWISIKATVRFTTVSRQENSITERWFLCVIREMSGVGMEHVASLEIGD
jgi:hypothetical protein